MIPPAASAALIRSSPPSIVAIRGAEGATVSTVTEMAVESGPALPTASVNVAVTLNVPSPRAPIVARRHRHRRAVGRRCRPRGAKSDHLAAPAEVSVSPATAPVSVRPTTTGVPSEASLALIPPLPFSGRGDRRRRRPQRGRQEDIGASRTVRCRLGTNQFPEETGDAAQMQDGAVGQRDRPGGAGTDSSRCNRDGIVTKNMDQVRRREGASDIKADNRVVEPFRRDAGKRQFTV